MRHATEVAVSNRAASRYRSGRCVLWEKAVHRVLRAAVSYSTIGAASVQRSPYTRARPSRASLLALSRLVARW